MVTSPYAAEKRRFVRHFLKVPIEVRKISHQASRTQTQDLSLGGLSFLWHESISRGTMIQLKIPVAGKLFETHAVVAYSRKDDIKDYFHTGAAFRDEESAFKAKLAEEIIRMQDYRKKLSKSLGHEVSEEESAEHWIKSHAEKFSELFKGPEHDN